MQTTDASGVALTTAALDAIASADSRWDERATISWPGGLYPDATPMIVSAQVDATLVGGVPDQSRRPVGFQSRTLKLVLNGMVDDTAESFDAFALLNPLNSASVFYRKDLRGTKLTYDVGPYVRGSATPTWIRQFTGQIDDITINDDGTVTLDCLDRMAELRPVVAMPAVVTAPPYNAGLTLEFGHDALLRNASGGTISSWPAQRPQCVLAVGMRSSVWPEVGSLADSATIGGDQLVPTFAPGVFGTALNALSTTDTTTSYGNLVYVLSSGDLGTRAFIECWVNNLDSSSEIFLNLTPATISFNSVYMKVHSTGITIGVIGSGGNEFTWTTTINSGPHYVAASIVLPAVGGTVSSATLYLDAASRTTGTLTWGGPRNSTPMNALLVSPNSHGTIEAIQVTTETAPALNNLFSPQAVLAPSLSRLLVTPAVSGDPLGTLKDISTAELSTAGFDEKGVYRSVNRAQRRGGIAVGTFTSDSGLDTVEIQLTGAGYANRVQAPVQTWKFAAPATVWSTEVVQVIPGTTTGYSFIVDTADVLVAGVGGAPTLLPDGGGNDGRSYYRASADPAGRTVHNGLKNGRISQIDSTHFRVTFDNTWQHKAYLITPIGYSDHGPGFPTLQIGGIAASTADALVADSQWPPLAEGGAKTTPIRGEVPYNFPASDWQQDLASAQSLTDDTLCELRRPVLDLTKVAMTRPHAGLQVGDRIHLTAANLYLDDDVTVFGIHNSSANGQAAQSLDVRMVAAPGIWVLGVPGRCELGVNTYV